VSARRGDVLVLGGGVVGLACALELLRAGRGVTLLEQGRAGGATSHGNCGTITPSHATPLAMPGMIGEALAQVLRADAPFRVKPRFDPALWAWMLQFARRCNWRDFDRVNRIKAPLLMRSRRAIEALVRDERLDCEFEARGTMYVYRDPAAFERAQWMPRALREVDVPIEVLDGTAARAREPALNERIVGAYYNPADGHLRPDRYVAELARRVRERGGTILEQEPVLALHARAGAIESVETQGARHVARDYVLAMGVWSPGLARTLDLRLPIQPGKGYSITYDRPARCPRIPLVCKERSVCVTAWSSGYRLGSTMEFAGFDASLNRTRLDALERGAGEYLHEAVGPRRIEEWYGWRPMTWDDLPIIGRSPRHPNLVLATGHGMLGVTMSAVTAELVTDLICARPPALDPAPLGLQRFA